MLGGLVLVILLVAAAGAATLLSAPADHKNLPTDHDYVAFNGMPLPPFVPSAGPDASTGSFVSACGLNMQHHQNADNVISSPRTPGAAHHAHEYVGNLSTDAFSTNGTLAAAGTTCSNGDLSVYYWPVLRVLPGQDGAAVTHQAGRDSEASDGNAGTRVPPTTVLVEFRGNPTRQVVAMPRFLRIVTGDAHAATASAGALGRARWSCSGLPDRYTQLYPLCPQGQQVVRTFDYPSCWDGRRIDSDNHRRQVVFPAGNGGCPRDTVPVPQLRLRVAYTVPPGRSFAIDTFPDQRRSPTTDHADFINVMPDALMHRVVACVNGGRRC